jgi:D-alanine-D-alanine ligase
MNLPAPRQLSDARDFGHVAVLVGGDSAEREVSLDGGIAITASLERSGISYSIHDGASSLFHEISQNRPDRVFNLMHGPGGEDGSVQGALDLMGVPHTGSGVLASALSMDKIRSKWIWQKLGIPTPEFEQIEAGDDVDESLPERLGLPLFIKPCGLGSSIGVSRVTSVEELGPAVSLARQYSPVVLAEPAIIGNEYFAAVLGRTTLPLIRIETPNAFYDYEAKYESDQTSYFCPCGLNPGLEASLQRQSLAAFDALGASGWGRVDFILDENNTPWFLEINTIPGMTGHSLVPQAAEVAGVGFDELVWRILETSL